jgi:hypothetical protein
MARLWHHHKGHAAYRRKLHLPMSVRHHVFPGVEIPVTIETIPAFFSLKRPCRPVGTNKNENLFSGEITPALQTINSWAAN